MEARSHFGALCSPGKDEQVAKLQQDVAEAREKLNVLVEEKHQYLMQQNSMLMNQQARSLPAHAFRFGNLV